MNAVASVTAAPFEDIIPFLSEHVQPSDQLLFLGASSDLALQLAKAGYGTKKTGFMVVVDDNQKYIDECKALAAADPELANLVESGKLDFRTVDLTNMADVCKQSIYDAIIDSGAIDSLLTSSDGPRKALKCIDHLQDAVRLGNILVSLSKLEAKQFCAPFEERFGWVQELDGDPGEISGIRYLTY